jgi:hypothetical protein
MEKSEFVDIYKYDGLYRVPRTIHYTIKEYHDSVSYFEYCIRKTINVENKRVINSIKEIVSVIVVNDLKLVARFNIKEK